ncbi:MAG: heparin/heparin-sulfate lyase HepB [Verrucomicrobiota bacterium]
MLKTICSPDFSPTHNAFITVVRCLIILAGFAVSAFTAEPIPPLPVTPPAGHPRLFVRSSDVADLKARMTDPIFGKAWRQVLLHSTSTFDGTLASTPANYVPRIHDVGEACALRFLLEGDVAQGKKAIAIMRKVLPSVTYPNEQDITRAKGATILTAAIVYDWCYPLLSPMDRALFITHMKRIAKLTEIGYPPVKGSAITGHSGEAQLMRDQLGAGIATYDEDREIYQFAARRFFAEFVPARNFWYPGNWHHQGSSYGPYRFQWEMFASWIFKRMSGVDVFNPDQGQVPFAWVYAQRPDGVLMADGDCSSIPKRNTKPASPNISMFLAANYYHDKVLNGVVMQQNQIKDSLSGSIWYFLFTDTGLDTKPVTSLPLSRYFPDPAGRLIARTGWGEGPTAPMAIAEMKISPWMFNNHQHLDAGSFQIWFKGSLACDSGVYDRYGSDHDYNYNKRTIAHNTITIFDPTEVFNRGKATPVANDGGQRWPAQSTEPATLTLLKEQGHQVGRVLAHAIGPDPVKPRFSHLAGDLTGSYSKKLEHFIRSFVFLNLDDAKHPAALIIYDRVRSANPSFKKTWLLHCPDRPTLAESGFTVHGTWGGRMDASMILPTKDDVRLETIGGVGNEFIVNGTNYPTASTKGAGPEYENCGWRIELSPKTQRNDDRFLVVMQMMDEGTSATPLPLTRMEGEGWTGVVIANRAVIFPKGYIDLNQVNFRLAAPAHCLVTGAAVGTWSIRCGGTIQTATVTDSGRVLEFTAPAGSVEALKGSLP